MPQWLVEYLVAGLFGAVFATGGGWVLFRVQQRFQEQQEEQTRIAIRSYLAVGMSAALEYDRDEDTACVAYLTGVLTEPMLSKAVEHLSVEETLFLFQAERILRDMLLRPNWRHAVQSGQLDAKPLRDMVLVALKQIAEADPPSVNLVETLAGIDLATYQTPEKNLCEEDGSGNSADHHGDEA